MLAFSLWLRASVVAALVLFVSVAAREAYAANTPGNVMCKGFLQAGPTYSCTSAGGAVTCMSWDFPGQTSLPVADSGNSFAFAGPTSSQYRTLGTACDAGHLFVVLYKGDYDLLINSGNVVTKLQEGYDLGVIAVVIIALIAGFWFGWKVTQRGTSQ